MLPPGFPTLRILPLCRLLLHESHDGQRASPLSEKLRVEGILRNPPIVMPLPDHTGRYMVLDGANRITALTDLEFPHTVAQVVQATDRGVSLHPWNHVIWGISPRTLMIHLRRIKGLSLYALRPHRSVAAPRLAPMQVHLADGRSFLVTLPARMSSRVRALRQLVDAYQDRSSVDRTSQTLIDSFRNLYADLTGLIVFPRFDVATVLRLAGSGMILPPGITRFTVSPRALHLNFPLHELSSARPLAEKQAFLDRWVEDRVTSKGVRMYVETTYLFDE